MILRSQGSKKVRSASSSFLVGVCNQTIPKTPPDLVLLFPKKKHQQKLRTTKHLLPILHLVLSIVLCFRLALLAIGCWLATTLRDRPNRRGEAATGWSKGRTPGRMEAHGKEHERKHERLHPRKKALWFFWGGKTGKTVRFASL